MTADLTIGQVAKRTGLNIQTVRYYERRGLVLPDDHRESGYRLYTQEAVKKIHFIKNAQALGFTLKEISTLLRLKVSDRAHCEDVKKKAQAKAEDVRSKITKLKAIEKVLNRLIKTCQVKKTTENCPILKSLDMGG